VPSATEIARLRTVEPGQCSAASPDGERACVGRVRFVSTLLRTGSSDCVLGRLGRSGTSRPVFRSRRARRWPLLGATIHPDAGGHREVGNQARRPELWACRPR
jgi:hypothetical protein